MYPLIIYGFLLENRIGRWRYLLIYIASMVGATLLINYIGGSYALHTLKQADGFLQFRHWMPGRKASDVSLQNV